MPRVPTYEGPQVRPGGPAAQYQQTPDVSAPARAAGAALSSIGEVADRVVQRQDQDVAWRTQAAINEEWVKFDAEARKNAKGNKAGGYADSVKGWWDKAAADYGKDLTPSQRALISKNLTLARGQAYEGALKYENGELERSRLEALDGALSAEISRGSAGGPSAAAASASIMTDMLQKFGAEQGKPKEWIDEQILKRTTAMHANVISSLMQQDPKKAQEYFDANKGQIDGARHDEIGAKLNAVSAAADGDAAAERIWSTVKEGQPVELDKLEAEARKAFANDPTRQKHAIAGIRERAQAFEKARNEREAAGVNAVYKMIDAGIPMSRVQRSPEWQSIDGKSQDQILYQQEQRANARAQRAAADAGRALAEMQRADKMALLTNGSAYLRYSDPEVLAKMSRPEVEASRSVFGFEGAQHLLSRWDALQKPGAIAEARMDTEDFNHVADQLGLKPYDSSKSESQKKALGELKYRVEQLINIEQQAGKKTLTRDEKNELMRREMAKTVTVNGLLWNDTVPIIQLDPNQASKVVVPASDKAAIAAALKTMYDQSGGNAMYAPTEENMRRLYLMKQSRAAALIEPAK